MKIVHTEASLGWGGQEIRILEESRGMMARGHELLLLCPPEARIHQEAQRCGIPVQPLPIGKKRLAGVLAMHRWLNEHPVDLINTHSSTDSWLVALACSLRANAPAVVRTRHISAAVSSNPATRWLYTRGCQHVVTTGEALRRELIDGNGFPAAHITSVPTGIDPQRFAPGDRQAACVRLGLDPACLHVGIVATLRSWKGHLYLLEAFARLELPMCRLLIVGEGPMRPNIEARIAELGLTDRVSLVGQQDQPEHWMQAIDVFCLPSYANEGVPQAILQAMLSGLPIISTPVGAITEAITHGETGLIVPARDADALYQALQDLLGAPERRRLLGTRARQEAAARFSLASMLDRMESIFQSAVAGRTGV